MNTVLSSLREVLSQRGVRVSGAFVVIRIIKVDDSVQEFHHFIRADDSGSLDNLSRQYRGIRERFLGEVSPTAWCRGQGPGLLKRAFLLTLLAKFEGGRMTPILELDLRRKADDMLGIIVGTSDFIDQHLSDRREDVFPLTDGATPYRRRLSGRRVSPAKIQWDVVPWSFVDYFNGSPLVHTPTKTRQERPARG